MPSCDGLARFDSRPPDAHRVEGGASREEQRPVVRPAESAVGGNFGRADRPQMVSARIEYPSAAWARAEDAPFDIYFHAVGDALFRG
jgi:hypothetical protein